MQNYLYGGAKKIHAHHTIPVNESIQCLDWHLRNLATGWLCIKEVSNKKHYKIHSKRIKRAHHINKAGFVIFH